MKNINELLINVVERYLFHIHYHSDNPILQQIAKNMSEIENDEMWILTQK